MELYKIIADCANDASTYQLVCIPENFEGVQITQKFSWIPPMGFTPTFSLKTMKIVKADKTYVDAIFDTYGLESIVAFAIYKLNSTATDYVLQSAFAIDFESYQKYDVYSEFALKSISCIDEYNKIKNSAKNFSGVTQLTLPTTQNFINYVSVKKLTGVVKSGDASLEGYQGYLDLEENEDSDVRNNDTALYPENKMLYYFDRGASGTADLAIKAAGSLTVTLTTSTSSTIFVRIYKANGAISYANPILTLGTKAFVGSSATITFDVEKTIIRDYAFDDKDYFFVGVEAYDTGLVMDGIYGTCSVELYVSTEENANQFDRKVPYLTAETVLDELFNDSATIETSLKSIGVTASQSILKRLNYISFIPKDFMTDFCIATGSLVNFNNDGTVDIQKIDTYFTTLLQKSNAITLTYWSDLVISPDTTLNFSGVSVGMDQKEYTVLTYLNDWNKILTFIQADRAASESLNLQLTKFRVDYSGLIDYINKMSPASTDTSTDLFLINPAMSSRSTLEGDIYDMFTPRDILENHRRFLEFCFYNYGKDTLTIASSDGDNYNLAIDGVNQMDDFVLSGTKPKILPLKVEFTCLITATDFTKKILKIVTDEAELFIFVTEAQTTDYLSEQKIKGNLILFTP